MLSSLRASVFGPRRRVATSDATSKHASHSPCPHLLFSNECPTSEEAVAIQETIQRAEASLTSLVNIYQAQKTVSVKVEISETKEYISIHKSILGPFRRLPLEIIQDIMIHVVSVSYIHNHERLPEEVRKVPWQLGHISARWRRAALGCASLWSRYSLRIAANVLTNQRLLEATKEALSRSNTHPIELLFDTDSLEELSSNKALDVARPFVDLLVEHSERWGEVIIACPPSIIKSFSPIQLRLPNLRRLKLYARPSNPQSLTVDGPLDLFSSAPKLTRVKFHSPRELEADISFPFPQLVEYGHYFGSKINLERAISRLDSQLVSVVLCVTQLAYCPDEIFLPRLQHLTLLALGGDAQSTSTMVTTFLANTKAPTLTRLQLDLNQYPTFQTFGDDIVTAITSFIATSAQNHAAHSSLLEEFKLSFALPNDRLLPRLQFLDLVPRLTHLMIDQMSKGDWMMLINPSFLPQLRRLQVGIGGVVEGHRRELYSGEGLVKSWMSSSINSIRKARCPLPHLKEDQMPSSLASTEEQSRPWNAIVVAHTPRGLEEIYVNHASYFHVSNPHWRALEGSTTGPPLLVKARQDLMAIFPNTTSGIPRRAAIRRADCERLFKAKRNDKDVNHAKLVVMLLEDLLVKNSLTYSDIMSSEFFTYIQAFVREDTWSDSTDDVNIKDLKNRMTSVFEEMDTICCQAIQNFECCWVPSSQTNSVVYLSTKDARQAKCSSVY